MKKIVILFTVFGLLLLVGCNKKENTNDLVSPTTDPVDVVTTTEDPNQWELPIDTDIVVDTTAPEETTEESTEPTTVEEPTEEGTTEKVTTGHCTEPSEPATTEPEVTTTVATTEAPTEPTPVEPETTVPSTTKSGAIELPMIPG